MKKILLALSALLSIILFINVAYASDDYPDISSKYVKPSIFPCIMTIWGNKLWLITP